MFWHPSHGARQPLIHYSLLFPDNLTVEEYKVDLRTINGAVVSKHFVDAPITAKSALEATTKRKRRTSSGGQVNYNTVFERPSHLERIAYWDEDGVRRERMVSPRALKTFQCYWDEDTEAWRAGYVGMVWFVMTTDDHMDTQIVRRQFQHNFKRDSVSMVEITSLTRERQRGIWTLKGVMPARLCSLIHSTLVSGGRLLGQDINTNGVLGLQQDQRGRLRAPPSGRRRAKIWLDHVNWMTIVFVQCICNSVYSSMRLQINYFKNPIACIPSISFTCSILGLSWIIVRVQLV